jgi:hypothetical protein
MPATYHNVREEVRVITSLINDPYWQHTTSDEAEYANRFHQSREYRVHKEKFDAAATANAADGQTGESVRPSRPGGEADVTQTALDDTSKTPTCPSPTASLLLPFSSEPQENPVDAVPMSSTFQEEGQQLDAKAAAHPSSSAAQASSTSLVSPVPAYPEKAQKLEEVRVDFTGVANTTREVAVVSAAITLINLVVSNRVFIKPRNLVVSAIHLTEVSPALDEPSSSTSCYHAAHSLM